MHWYVNFPRDHWEDRTYTYMGTKSFLDTLKEIVISQWSLHSWYEELPNNTNICKSIQLSILAGNKA